MLRHLPRDYMQAESEVWRALVAEDPAGVRAVMDRLGYLPDPWPFDDELLYAHMRGASEWMLDAARQPLRLDGAMGYEMMEALLSLGPEWQRMVRSFSLPREALLLRRMENMVYSVCADLRAACDWRALGDELRGGEPPRTDLGREHAAWLA
jgi:hypothetical protein